MIVKYNDDFFIQWDVVFPLESNLNLGIFNFWIRDQCFPAKGINITLNTLFIDLTNNILEIINQKNDLGNIPIEKIIFSFSDDNRMVWLDTGELFQFGFGLIIGFDKDKERIFYTVDYEKTYNELVLPKGTLLKTLSILKENI